MYSFEYFSINLHVFYRHPEILTENFKDLSTKPYNGIIKCTLQPPRRLYHPVLPYRVSDKLLFPLCATCAVTKEEICEHSEEHRALHGAWVSLEVYKAMELGYKVNLKYAVYACCFDYKLKI